MDSDMWYHILMRDDDGWTWLYASNTSKASIDDSLVRDRRSYPKRAFVVIEEKGFDAARQRVQRINLKNKGHKIHPERLKEIEEYKKKSLQVSQT